jgi:hypothetical protein
MVMSMELSHEMFQSCPVWVDDEDQEGFEPVSTGETLPDDDLYVSAEFFVGDRSLPGCVRTDGLFAAFFLPTQTIYLNTLLQLPEGDRLALAASVGVSEAMLFPLNFRTKFKFPDGRPVAGHVAPGPGSIDP